MPEGHTIHRLARDHRRDFVGKRLRVSSPQGRFAEEAQQLDRKQLTRTDAWGKHLFHHWSAGRIVHIHLGLYGKFMRCSVPPQPPRDTVRLRVLGSEQAFDLVGPNCCELIDEEGKQRIVDRLGADPLRDDADVDRARERICRSRAPIGTLLLNQSVIAGVGNVYRADVLFDQRIHPERPGRELSTEEFDRIWQRLGEFLKIGVRYNRIITVDVKKAGRPASRIKRRERLLVYGRERCTECGSPIETWELGNRRIYACTVCQT